ncbi:MAG: sugar phosphate isomerase/epimerase family protein, partial [Candidatus Latescibacteria bacterium]|nr:sugar phosphate isomerase/epimerase family protein [Candidatus Latescibacterota bacterium]
EDMQSLVQSSGAQACSISFAMFREYKGAQDNAEIRDRVVGLVNKAVQACKGMGGAGVLLPYFDRENIDISRADADLLVEDLKRCAPLAEDLGIKLALETSFTSGLLKDICDGVGSEMVGVYQDMANALIYGHDSVEMFLDLPEHTKLVHLKDTKKSDLGEGDVDFPACRDAIAKIGYEGWLTFETPAGDDPIASGKKNLAYAREMFG